MVISEDAAYNKMSALCARAEYCSGDIRKKLVRMGLCETDCARVLKRLQQERFVDDGRYALSYSRDKARFSGWGEVKIRYMLRSKGVADGYIDDALAEVREDSLYDGPLATLLRRLFERERKKEGVDEYRIKASVISKAMARGYTYAQISAIIGELE